MFEFHFSSQQLNEGMRPLITLQLDRCSRSVLLFYFMEGGAQNWACRDVTKATKHWI